MSFFGTLLAPKTGLASAQGKDPIKMAKDANRSPDMSTYAQDTFAALTREQWSNYVTNFVPYENKLIEYASDPNVVSGAMSEASQQVNSAFDNQQAATTRRLGGLGLTLDADEQRASTRSMGLARSLADVNAQNTSRDATIARQQSIMGNPMPQLKGLGS